MTELILKRRYLARIIVYSCLALATLFFGLYYYYFYPSPWPVVGYLVVLLPAAGYFFLPYKKPSQFIVNDGKLAVHYNYDEITHRLSDLEWWASGNADMRTVGHISWLNYNWIIIKFNDSKLKVYSYEYANSRELVLFLFENYKAKWNPEAPAPVI